MKAIFKVVTIILMLCTNYSYSFAQVKHSICNDVIISTKLKNWTVINDKKKYIDSGKWDDNDDNGSIKPMPDTVDVILDMELKAYYLKHAFLINDVKSDDFLFSVEVKLKMGESKDCINVLNPSTLNLGTLLNSQNIEYSSFFHEKKYHNKQIKIPFAIKKAYDIVKGSNLILNQIIFIIKLKSKSTGQECLIEYIKPIC